MWTSELPVLGALLRGSCLLFGALTVGALVHGFLAVPALLPPRFGLRGKRRAKARASALFRHAEPALEQLAAIVAGCRLAPVRSWLQELVRGAGEPAGLCADEVLALSLLCLAGPGCLTAWLVLQAGFQPIWAAVSLVLVTGLPASRLRVLSQTRAKELERSLPTAMDLCVLCMGAGADFPGALRFVVRELGEAHAVCQEELGLVLDELELGRTRVQALTALGLRTQSRAVRDFTAAVCQSETKGTPLIDALTIQAVGLRQRRSVLAEEAAAKASVRLMFPLMLMVASLLLIVFGPFLVNGLGM